MTTDTKLARQLRDAGWELKHDPNWDIWHTHMEGYHLKVDIMRSGKAFFRAVCYDSWHYAVKDIRVTSLGQVLYLFNRAMHPPAGGMRSDCGAMPRPA